jgi:hypothetical protein
VSWWRRFVTVGREIEVFYDRRILGFDSGDQVQLAEVFRDSLGGAGRSMQFWKGTGGGVFPGGARVVVVLLGLTVLGLIALKGIRRRPATPPATRAYLALRRTLAQRIGGLTAAVPPAEVVRLFAAHAPGSAADARAVVDAYCETAFGGRPIDAARARELNDRVRRLKRLAS